MTRQSHQPVDNRTVPQPSTVDKINRGVSSEKEDRIIITYYTDPLCCWSWAFEESWRRLLAKHGDRITYSLVMFAMCAGRATYRDLVLTCSTPAQLRPRWCYYCLLIHSIMHIRCVDLYPHSVS